MSILSTESCLLASRIRSPAFFSSSTLLSCSLAFTSSLLISYSASMIAFLRSVIELSAFWTLVCLASIYAYSRCTLPPSLESKFCSRLLDTSGWLPIYTPNSSLRVCYISHSLSSSFPNCFSISSKSFLCSLCFYSVPFKL